MSDIQTALESVKSIGLQSSGSMKSLQPKNELLLHLLSSEHTRLTVWLFPLGAERKHYAIHHSRAPPEVSVSP
jgi:phosphatidylinositol 4-kinase